MKKILLIDYYGICDENGKAIGHSPKVLKEYGDLLKGEYVRSVAASPCLINEVAGEQTHNFHKVYSLKYNIMTSGMTSFWKRVKDKFKLFYNLHQVFQIDDYDIFWFYKTDFFLALYLYLFISGKRKKENKPKIVVLLYQNSFGDNIPGRILNHIYYAGFKKADGIISTQEGFKDLGIPALYIPDYYYDTRKYEKYLVMEKVDKAVCIGTMSPYKKLDELISVFNQNGYELEIKGYFYDKSFYTNLCNKINHNIVIEDRVLTEEEYYRTLAEAKYTILPYDMKQYQCRTSGVLIESLFLNTTAIAPKQLLQQNQIEGIGYSDIEELADAAFFENKTPPDNRIKKLEFDKEEAGRRLREFMNSI